MRIVSIHVKNNIRFRLNNELSEFTFEPDKKISVIVGTNSCGKSSLLELMTGYPPSHTDLLEGGKVVVRIEHRDVFYKLSLHKDTKVTYGFSVNGEELNKGGGVKTQRMLVEENLGINKTIHELLLGRLTFSNMSINKRKDMFVSLSDTDYDYILSVYDKIKKDLNYKKAIVKHTKNQLLQELHESFDVKDIESKITDKNKSLESILDFKEKTTRSVNDTKTAICDNISEVKQKLTNRKIVLRDMWDHGKLIPKDEYTIQDIALTSMKAKEDILKSELKKETADYSEKDSEWTALGIDDLPEEEYLRKNIALLESKIENNPHDIYLTTDEKLNELYIILTDIEYISTYLEQNGNVKYAGLDKVILRNMEITNELAMLAGSQDELRDKHREQVYLKKHDVQTCPKCSHKWYTEFDHNELYRVETEIKRVELLINELSREQHDGAHIIKNGNLYRDTYSMYVSMKKEHDIPTLWNILTNDFMANSPNKASVILNKLIEGTKQYLTTAGYKEQIRENVKYLSIRESLDNESSRNHEDKMHRHQVQIEEMQEECHMLRDNIEYVSTFLNKRRLLSDIDEELSTLVSEHRMLLGELSTTIKQEALRLSYMEYKSDLFELEGELSKARLQQANIDRMENELNELKSERENIELLLLSLSPNTGFIGESLSGFIGVFIGNMNAILNDIWTFPIEVKMPTLVSNKLTYKFPFTLDNNDSISDISLGSAGVCEVIDLAYRMTVLDKLEMNDYPLFLDEFAVRFDDEHRISCFKYIEEVLANGNFSHIFIISHYISSYAGFSDPVTDFTVLSDTNVNTRMISAPINMCLTKL